MERRNSEAQRERQRRRIFEIVEIGAADDLLSRGYDFFGSLVVVLALGERAWPPPSTGRRSAAGCC